MDFKEAYELKIGDHVEKKGKYSYLSWCYAVKHIRENFPEATWIIHENVDGFPCFFHNDQAMVKISVNINEKEHTQWHPVLNYQNKPINKPSVFEINTAIQRCLAKAVAISTGIGLGLYAGEDLPKEEADATNNGTSEEPTPITEIQAKKVKTLIAETDSDIEALLKFFKVDSIDAMTVPQFSKAVQMLNQKVAG